MKKSILLSFLVLAAFMVSATGANAALVESATTAQIFLTYKGESVTFNGATFHEFDDPDQATVSAGSGVIDPFLTIQQNGNEEGINSDASGPMVLDTTRPMYNHSITVGDLEAVNNELLLDINEPKAGNSKFLTQHELQIWVLDNSYGGEYGGSALTVGDLASVGTLVWDLDSAKDATIEIDYGLWQGSGQNIDMSVTFASNLFSAFNTDDFVYVYAQFGQLPDDGGFYGENYKSQDGFEEYVLREGGEGFPPVIPEPATMFLLGTGLVGVAGASRRKRMRKNQA